MATYKEYKTKKGKYWAVKAYLGIDPLTNKQVNIEKRGFKSRKEAKLFIDRKAMEIEKTGSLVARRQTLKRCMSYGWKHIS
ncbi:Arm DNA-binding domain-containing protein [Enterococcus avium]